MTIPVIVLIIALVLIIVFFKDFHAFVYAFVMIDIFLRIVTYLKMYIINVYMIFLGLLFSKFVNRKF